MSRQRNNLITKISVFLFWIGVWTAASLAVHQELLIPAPWTVVFHLYNIIRKGTFLKVVFTSLMRVLGGLDRKSVV